MIKELLYKWFGIEPPSCATCEVLRLQLGESNRERKELLHKLLERNDPEPQPVQTTEPPVPVMPRHIPWHVRQRELERTDRDVAAQLKAAKERELETSRGMQNTPTIEQLEKELGVVTGD